MNGASGLLRKTLALKAAGALFLAVLVGLCFAPSAHALTLSKSSVTLHYGKTASLSVGGVSIDQAVKWTSSDKSVATVKKSGSFGAVLTGVAPGSAKVTATVNGQTVTCKVKVPRYKVLQTVKKTCKVTWTVRCSHCGKKYAVSQKTHRWKTLSSRTATYFKSGYVKRSCKKCGKVVKTTTKKTPPAPTAASYALADPTTGWADGTVTVRVPEKIASFKTNIVMYWGDETGYVSSFSNLARVHATTVETKIDLPERSIIPQKATRLYVFTKTNGVRSAGGIAIDLPQDRNYLPKGKLLTRFQVISDLHVNSDTSDVLRRRGARNTAKALKDIAKVNPDSMTVVVGDMVDRGREAEYKQLAKLISAQAGVSRKNVYYTMGNHDTFSAKRRVETTKAKQQALQELFKEQAINAKGVEFTSISPSAVYYSYVKSGYHHIVLGNEDASQYLDATIGPKQLAWLSKQLEAAKADTGNKPIFVYLHQSLYNTVAGGLKGQGWDGVSTAHTNKKDGSGRDLLRQMLQDYPQVMLFDGHSHWSLNSTRNMHVRNLNDDGLPSIFNTAAVAYLSSSYDDPEDKQYVDYSGSQGYYIKVYENGVQVLGRDFLGGKYLPSACYYIENVMDPEPPASPDVPDEGDENEGSEGSGEVVVQGTPTSVMPQGFDAIEEERTVGDPDLEGLLAE